MAKKEYISLVTDWMPVVYAANIKAQPNTLKAGEPLEYTMELEPTPEQIAAWTKKVKAAFPTATFKAKNPKFGISVKGSGDITIRAASKLKPMCFDSKNNPLVDPKIGKGSIVRLVVNPYVYEQQGGGIGIGLSQIQIKKLVEWESTAQKSAFDEDEDGYVADTGSQFGEEDGKSPLDL